MMARKPAAWPAGSFISGTAVAHGTDPAVVLINAKAAAAKAASGDMINANDGFPTLKRVSDPETGFRP